MKRREFINKSVQAGLVAGAVVTVGDVAPLMADEVNRPIDLVAVKGGTPDQMFDQGIAALGGMKNFVKKGQKVLVKPNIGWNKTPEFAANTNPDLVKRIIEHCFKAGAKEVYVFDHTCHKWQLCYTNSGIEKAAKDAGAKLVPGNSESYYKKVSIEKGLKLKDTKVHELLMEADVFINVPVLKHHSSTRVSLAMKNLMGVVWDRGYYHKNDLHQCIADFLYYRKPDLNVVDAYRAMTQNGPVGVSTDDVLDMGAQLISKDIVAVDAASVKFLKKDPAKIGHIKKAHDMGFGNMNLNELNIHRIKI
ncbi:DUF362 domain-containing protein [Prolixibacteraceae bacterium JC049]|nr:DUF362 domain-containing protein [Prolixibacteraceae bacterium JC049]